MPTQAYHTTITSLQIEEFALYPGCPTLLCDISTDHPRPNLPTTWRRWEFNQVHGFFHPSIRSTVCLISDRACVTLARPRIIAHLKLPLREFWFYIHLRMRKHFQTHLTAWRICKLHTDSTQDDTQENADAGT
ncbi:uncharacterized protein [Narcine bancroftii]|uniref:uncharacterized protein isoform X2 n=1 Tax=Narcine bancroftii TaxID=1343680 RepID=UPI003831ACE0